MPAESLAGCVRGAAGWRFLLIAMLTGGSCPGAAASSEPPRDNGLTARIATIWRRVDGNNKDNKEDEQTEKKRESVVETVEAQGERGVDRLFLEGGHVGNGRWRAEWTALPVPIAIRTCRFLRGHY